MSSIGRSHTMIALVLALVAFSACAGPTSSPNATTSVPLRATATGGLSSSASPAAPSPTEPNAAIPLPYGCTETNPCQLDAGTYALAGAFAFMPGLVVSVPVPWSSGEQDRGEFSIAPTGATGGLFFWKDLSPVDHSGTPLLKVGWSAASLADWLRHNPDLVTSAPADVTIGTNIRAITLLVGVSKSAKNADPGCPVAVCVPVVTDPAHWGQPYDIGRQADPLYFRLYVADIATGSTPHTLVVALDAGDAAGLKGLEALAAPIVNSVVLPPGTTPAGKPGS